MNLFGTAGIRGSTTDSVTPELALGVGRAVGALAGDAGVDEVAVGRDGRTTGPGIAAAVESGLLSTGVAVRRIGVVPTPALAFASRGRWGVMITASHNPPTDNGIKLFADGVEFDREAERRVEATAAEEPSPVDWDRWSDVRREQALSAYRQAVCEYASGRGDPLDGLGVAVDCGNGTASLATPQVLADLGARVVTLNANVDGHFPGRESKPTAASLADFRAFVRGGDALTFGVGQDGDADRIVVVDGGGEVVHEDTVLAILAEHYVDESAATDPVVVTTPNASARIDERVRTAGGRVERVRLGALHEGVAAAREAGGHVVFAAEPWKHVHPGFGDWIDGVASAAVLARLVAASGLPSLRDRVTERPYRKESVACSDGQKDRVMQRLESTLPAAFPDATVDTDYGVRLTFPNDSWVLVRPSGTESYVRVYAESPAVDELIRAVERLVAEAVREA